MAFDVDADAYDRFMGRYAVPLATRFADLAGVVPGRRALDVGCGTGALTAVLVDRLGAASVCAVDPSASFTHAVERRFPGAEVRRGTAERLPYADAAFDVVLAQLVVHFMADPVAGLAEMRRVTRPGGVVAACVWDHAGGRSPLSLFWEVAREVDPGARDESRLAGAGAGDLLRLAGRAGWAEPEQGELTVLVRYRDAEEWWQPYLSGVGPAGDHVAALDADRREELHRRCRQRLPEGPFEVAATAWTVLSRT